MNSNIKSMTAAGGIFAVFALLGWQVPSALSGIGRWVLTAILVLLGAAAASIVYLLVRSRAARSTRSNDDEEIDAAVRAARKRLAAARLPDVRKPGLRTMPLLIAVGPGGSTKTSVLLNSGLDPELIAGETRRGTGIAPTTGVNIWYAHGAVIMEVGGKVLQEEKRWLRLIRHLQPSRVAAVLSRGRQAPRRVLVCFGCDELFKPGASESVPAAAQKLRARLVELAHQLGIELPVYVLFTKADRLPYFADYVRSMNRDEAQQVLGATLPIDLVEDSGWAERQDARLDHAFENLFRSLAGRRLSVLTRESEPEVRAGAYEFPREFNKIRELTVRFLVELTRPSQLGVEPVLRGFYFTGVRPIVVSDPTAAAAAASPVSSAPAPDATMVLNARDLAARSPAPAAGTRRVPEWVFVRRLFGDLIPSDRIALGLTGGGTRVNLLRRSFLGAAAVLLLLLSVGFATSFLNNGRLVNRANAAVTPVLPLAATDALASIDDLRALDSLRAVLEDLGRWHEDRPLDHQFGLYKGDALLEHLRPLYLGRFRTVLWARADSNLRAELQSTPAVIEEQATYGRFFDALKTHLVTTSAHAYGDSVGAQYVADRLTAYWRGEEPAAPERDSLAHAQFAFFGRQLSGLDRPFADSAPALVRQARASLGEFQTLEPQYAALLACAAGDREPVRFTAPLVRGGTEVPAAFRREGWEIVESNLPACLSRFSDDWVLGGAPASRLDWASVQDSLLKRYRRHYVDYWNRFLSDASVSGFDAARAPRVLAELSGQGSAPSPLMELFSRVSEHTFVDTLHVGPRFEAVHAIVEPRTLEHQAVEYRNALARLGNSFAQSDAGEDRIRDAAAGVQQQINALQLGGPSAPPARRLLYLPVQIALDRADALPRARINGAGRDFCAEFRALAARFPFGNGQEAGLEDVKALLQRGRSVLSSVTEGPLSEVVQDRGTQFVPRSSEHRLNDAFLRSLNRAAAVRDLLFNDGGDTRMVEIQIQPDLPNDGAIEEVVIEIGGDPHSFTKVLRDRHVFLWSVEEDRGARLVVRRASGEPIVRPYAGRWGVVRLLQAAEWSDSNRLTWRDLGLSAEIRVNPARPRLNDLTLSCTAQVIR